MATTKVYLGTRSINLPEVVDDIDVNRLLVSRCRHPEKREGFDHQQAVVDYVLYGKK